MVIKESAKTSKFTDHTKWSDFDVVNIDNRINAYFKESVANIPEGIKVVNKTWSFYDIPQPNCKMIQLKPATLN